MELKLTLLAGLENAVHPGDAMINVLPSAINSISAVGHELEHKDYAPEHRSQLHLFLGVQDNAGAELMSIDIEGAESIDALRRYCEMILAHHRDGWPVGG